MEKYRSDFFHCTEGLFSSDKNIFSVVTPGFISGTKTSNVFSAEQLSLTLVEER